MNCLLRNYFWGWESHRRRGRGNECGLGNQRDLGLTLELLPSCWTDESTSLSHSVPEGEVGRVSPEFTMALRGPDQII